MAARRHASAWAGEYTTQDCRNSKKKAKKCRTKIAAANAWYIPCVCSSYFFKFGQIGPHCRSPPSALLSITS